MSNVRNRVQLVGNLGSAPELKVFENNKLVRFSVATTEYKKNKAGESINETQWHNVIAWGKLAEMAEQNFEKGSRVFIDGKLVNRSYTDKEGNKRYVTEVVANDAYLVTKQQQAAS